MNMHTSNHPEEASQNDAILTHSKSHTSTYIVFLSIAFAVFILDQATKILVQHFLPLYHSKVIIPDLFSLVHVRNTGSAFSFLGGQASVWKRVFFVGVSLTAIGVIFYIHGQLKEADHGARTALALILGGAFGNLVDRLYHGEVVDFLDFYLGSFHWPAFNVADSAISVGSLFLLYILLFRSKHLLQ